MLSPDHPFAVHKLLYDAAFGDWDIARQGPPPVWSPTPEGVLCTNSGRFMRSYKVRSNTMPCETVHDYGAAEAACVVCPMSEYGVHCCA